MHMTKERYLAAAVLLMVAVMFIESGNIPDKTSWQMFGSAIYPRVLLGVIGVLAIALWVSSFVTAARARDTSGRRERPRPSARRPNPKVLGMFVLFGLYVLLLPMLGYIVATLLFMVVSQALLLGIDTPRKWLINLVTAGVLVPLIYVIFAYGLNVWLP